MQALAVQALINQPADGLQRLWVITRVQAHLGGAGATGGAAPLTMEALSAALSAALPVLAPDASICADAARTLAVVFGRLQENQADVRIICAVRAAHTEAMQNEKAAKKAAKYVANMGKNKRKRNELSVKDMTPEQLEMHREKWKASCGRRRSTENARIAELEKREKVLRPEVQELRSRVLRLEKENYKLVDKDMDWSRASSASTPVNDKPAASEKAAASDPPAATPHQRRPQRCTRPSPRP